MARVRSRARSAPRFGGMSGLTNAFSPSAVTRFTVLCNHMHPLKFWPMHARAYSASYVGVVAASMDEHFLAREPPLASGVLRGKTPSPKADIVSGKVCRTRGFPQPMVSIRPARLFSRNTHFPLSARGEQNGMSKCQTAPTRLIGTDGGDEDEGRAGQGDKFLRGCRHAP